jgi:hypothetical protein
MADWIRLNSRKTIDEFMESFGGFHDACLREVSIATETYVGQSGAMSCPAHLDTSVLMWFQSQGAKHRAVEIHCEGVSFLQLSATPAGCDSILSAGVLSNEGLRAGLVSALSAGRWSVHRTASSKSPRMIRTARQTS